MKKTPVDALYEIIENEIMATIACIKTTGFPFNKTLRFIEKKENILFIGSPKVGKTHLAIEIEATKHQYMERNLFFNLYQNNIDNPM